MKKILLACLVLLFIMPTGNAFSTSYVSRVVISEHRLEGGVEYFGVATWFGFTDELYLDDYATISGGPLSDELLNAPFEFTSGYNEFWYKWPEDSPSILPKFSNKDYFFKLFDASGTQIILENGDPNTGTVTLTSGNMQWLPFVGLTVTTIGDNTILTWNDISGYGPIYMYRVDLVNPDPTGPWSLETKISYDLDPNGIQSHSTLFYTKELFESYPEITFRVDARQFEEVEAGVWEFVNRSSLFYTQSFTDMLSDFVNALPPGAVKESRGIQTAFGSICEDIEEYIIEGDCDEAIRKLGNLRKRFDGCDDESDVPDKNDWIIDCEAQLELRELTDLLIENLTTNGCSF